MKQLKNGIPVILLFPLLILSCSEEKTEIILRIENQLPAGQTPDKINITGAAYNETKFSKDYNVKSNDFPFEILISSENDTEYAMTFTVSAYKGGNLLTTESAEKSFIKKRREKVVLVLRIKDLTDAGYDYGYDTQDTTDDTTDTDVADISDILQDIFDDTTADTQEIVCKTGFRDCNKEKDDGCETNILNNNDNCGECYHKCILDNAFSECKNGNCIITKCASGFENCDGKDETGCETNLATDSSHCGDCVTNCGDNSVCNNKVCDCKSGFGNCDKLWKTGCEINLYEDNLNCGECKKICPYKTHCAEGKCVCDDGFGDCDLNELTGCETDLSTDIKHCGECGKKCGTKNVKTILCENKVCNYDECLISYIDADTDRTNGCEEWSYFPKIYKTISYHTFTYSIHLLNTSYYITFVIYNNETKDFKTILTKTDINGNIIWNKYFSKVFYPKYVSNIGERIFLIGEEPLETFTNLLIIELDEKGVVVSTKLLSFENIISINSIQTTSNEILLFGEIYKKDNFSYTNGILIKYNTSGTINSKIYFESDNEKNSFILKSGITIDNSTFIIGNTVINQVPNKHMKGCIININNDLSVNKSFSFPDDEIISFEAVLKNSYNKTIIIGNQTNSVNNEFNHIKIAKLFLSGSTYFVEKANDIYLNDKNLDYIAQATTNDNFIIAGLSYNLDTLGKKDLMYHLILLDQDLNFAKGKTFYSDLIYFNMPLGLINILPNQSNEILTNIYLATPNNPINSLFFIITSELDQPDYCSQKLIYNTDFNQSNQNNALNLKNISSKEIIINIYNFDLQTTIYESLQAVNFCNKH